MSIEQQASYYDKIYASSKEYQKPYTESAYYQLWKKALEIIPKSVFITELGCGPGQFARMLHDEAYQKYVGYDFSDMAIAKAKSLVPEFNFFCQDITQNYLVGHFFVALEVFEHTRDYKIIENMGLGKTIVFSVPDFNDPAHVRYFHSVNEVVDRYKNVILFEYIQKIGSWYLCKGTTV